MKSNFTLFMASLLFISGSLFAQTDLPNLVKKAEMNFVEFDYFDALDGFNASFEKYPENHFCLRRIADCQRLLGLIEDSKASYLNLIELGGHDAMDYYYCAEVHRQLGEYESAQFYTAQFEQIAPEDSRSQLALENPTYYEELVKKNNAYTSTALELNDIRSLYPPTGSKDLLILPIAQLNEEPWFPHKRYIANYDLYETTMDKNFNLISAEPMQGSVNTKFSEGPSCYDSEREILYVTRFLTRKQQPSIDETGNVFSMISSYTKSEEGWVETGDFRFDFGMFSCAYPALSPDQQTLYFSSNQEGGAGRMDIYQCAWEGDKWGDPQPMDNGMNTEGDEIYPNFSPTGEFSFASDGHPGLGGLDIFFVKESGVVNPGMPVNSPKDDFGLVYMNGQYGYFCSDRDASRKGDDLFWWEELQEIIDTEIVLMDMEGNPLYPNKITITNAATGEKMLTSGQRGSFTAKLNGKDTYEFAWTQDDQELSMSARPSRSLIGLRYIYSSPHDGVFLADAKVTSYRQGNIKKKRIPNESWESKNLTNNEAYLSHTNSPAETFVLAEWNGDDSLTPGAGSSIFLKDLNTGQLQRFELGAGNTAEFAYQQDHVNALTWTTRSGEEVVKFIEPSAEGIGVVFTDHTQDWSLVLNNTSTMINSEDPAVFPELVASAATGFVTANITPEYEALVTAERSISTTTAGTSINLGAVYFGFDKSVLGERELSKLKLLLEELDDFSDLQLKVIAYTDSRGSAAYNMKLSKRRAAKTKEQLVRLGISPDQITIEWDGENQPTNNCTDEAPCPDLLHFKNRRAEIHVLLPAKD